MIVEMRDSHLLNDHFGTLRLTDQAISTSAGSIRAATVRERNGVQLVSA